MAVETTDGQVLGYIEEVTFGTTPATPTGKLLRMTGMNLNIEREFLESNELRSDRQEAAGRGGLILARPTVDGEFSFATFDDFMAACLANTWATNVLKVGSTRKSFTVEAKYSVNGLYYPLRGVVIDSMKMSADAKDKVLVTFGMVAAKVGQEATATIWSATTPANTNAIYAAWQANVKKGGANIASVTSFELNIENNFSEANTIGTQDLYDLNSNRVRVSGSFDAYFESNALYTDFRAENTVALQIFVGPGGTGTYTIDMTNARITNVSSPTDAGGLLKVTVQFRSFVHATDTSLKITRTAS